MDLTQIFKASVMTVKLRNKNIPNPHKNRILQKQPNNNELIKDAKDICFKITELRKLLFENRAAYMKFATYLKNSTQMSDEQRDIIDRECEKFINFYSRYIAQLKSKWKQRQSKKQINDHIESVLDLLYNYLKNVEKIHLEQKKHRVQHEIETYRLLKLASDKKKIPVKPVTNVSKNTTNDELNAKFHNLEGSKVGTDIEFERKIVSQKVAIDEDIQKNQQNNEENGLSPEDIQMFESENKQLYHELQGLSEEVEQIEKNVVDIAKLQEIFTEKVALQKNDIERIANAVVGATENVKDANEQINEAIQRNAGLRVYALFFLIVMSFSLLFLDWYNE